MSASQSLGGHSRCGRALGPSLDKIVKNAAWRKHSQLVSTCKSTLDKLESLSDSDDPQSLLYGLSSTDANFVLQPLLLALNSGYSKVVEPALECVYKLFSLGLARGEVDRPSDVGAPVSSCVLFNIIDATCNCGSLEEEAIELGVLRVLLSAVRSPSLLIRGDCLVHIVRNCYNIYLGGFNGTNQICAKSVLAQIMVIVFTRVEQDSMDVYMKRISVNELLEFADKNLNEGSSVHFSQNFINEVMEVSEGDPVPDSDLRSPEPPHQGPKDENGHAGSCQLNEAGTEVTGVSKIREDGFLLFTNICKLSMKFTTQQQPSDQILLRGKILSLELLKVVMDNGGPIWLSNERFLSAIKQYLCLSLLKNSALSAMAIFQLQCSIFWSLLSKYRSGLKAEIGIFFPMLILRVLENVLQPSFLQKMTVLNLLNKISEDPQIIIDIFVNYDCDLDFPNIFERIVNGLLKTALGPPPGSTTTLTSAQDITFRYESVKCLVSIIKSMGSWMDQQLTVANPDLPKSSESDTPAENASSFNGEEGTSSDCELHSEANSESSDAASLEQRRAYKMELQKGISLFNRKPAKGIEFLISTKKIGRSPEDVALFLKNTSGLNETMIGDYLGDREDFPLKVMHAYVDSFNFKGMDFGESIRFFLRGFRLPGEAQKIDRIMEKFAERYCKCSPSSFTSADTAYVLAYSVIMLNTDAHNSMVKDKMTKADFIRNNRGIDDGKDLPEEYLGALYDQIVKNEIKMNADLPTQQTKQENGLNRLLGLDGILNLVTGKQTEEKALGANGLLIRQIQEQFKAKSGKSESIYHTVTDVTILRFMVEVCWGPMIAAFSVTLDQSDDRIATSHCLLGFRHAVHITSMMGMQTQRDAFMSSIAKFTNLHCAADMKQKNVDAVKAIISIAIEDGNYLHEAWEHILTCLSRIEHLQLLGEGAPPDASFLSSSNIETEDKMSKSSGLTSLKRKGTIQNLAMAAVVRGGSYDSTAIGFNTPKLVTPEQINNFISNLNLLEQIGSFELNHVFAHSQRLNSEAIVSFVKALCKVSITELQSPTDPRVFSLTKIVEIAHYNMNRIRLVWSRIWNVLSDFFVAVGLSENLSVAIFVMDSLRQLAMKFLEREELANYNFQNEFLRPFVIVMKKSGSVEIRELIIRCISQMVLSRVSNVKSGWKSVFMVFTAAAADEQKNIVLLAFETMEKIVREYFPYITETETTTFTDCVRCLITFTNSRFNNDVSFNAIAFLRFCAVKLADGGLVCNQSSSLDDSTTMEVNDGLDLVASNDKDDPFSFWIPLLSGLSKLTCDPRPPIRKSSIEVFFNILKDHGHLFSNIFWNKIFSSLIFPMYNSANEKRDASSLDNQPSPTSGSTEVSVWDSETSTMAVDCLIDLFAIFFDVVRSQLPGVISVLAGYIKGPIQGPASVGVSGLMHLVSDLGGKFTDKEWEEIFVALKDAAISSMPGFMKILKTMDNVDVPKSPEASLDSERQSDYELASEDFDDDNLQISTYVLSRMKSHISMQLLIVQVVTDLYNMRQEPLSTAMAKVLSEIYSSIAFHAHQLNSQTMVLKKLQKACSVLELSFPPMVHFENESYQNYLNFLHNLLEENNSVSDEIDIETNFVALCTSILQMYLKCAGLASSLQTEPVLHWVLPLGSAKKEEMAARTSLVMSALNGMSGLSKESFKRYIPRFFPLLIDLVRCEHPSSEVQNMLSTMFQSCIGPIIT